MILMKKTILPSFLFADVSSVSLTPAADADNGDLIEKLNQLLRHLQTQPTPLPSKGRSAKPSPLPSANPRPSSSTSAPSPTPKSQKSRRSAALYQDFIQAIDNLRSLLSDVDNIRSLISDVDNL
ncbi:hypothetical protein ACLB2K_007128 [Fragaria x ananassa]